MTERKNSSPILELQKQYNLLQLEYEHEKEEFHNQLDIMGIPKRIKRGICWYPISLKRTFYNSLNLFCAEFERKDDIEIEHNFEYGKPVCFFSQNFSGNVHYFSPIGFINYADESRMIVVFPSSSTLTEIQTESSLGVQLYFDETSYRTMFEALTEVIKAKNNRLSELRDLLLGTSKITENTIFPIRFPWLNRSQEKAVNQVIGTKNVAVIHGPPGTGKTTTLVEAIYETLRRENQVMVCAQSNTAVDWISEKLVDRGINVLRIGNPTRVNDKMLSFTYERKFESHPHYTELWSIRKNIRELYNRVRKQQHKDSTYQKIERLKEKAVELEILIQEDLFREARVVASTLVSSANRILTGRKFTTLFIDEAAQALEAACWIAIRKTDRVVFAGDHCQLPPTIKCLEAAKGGLSRTLMEKIVDNHSHQVSLLSIQYRMNEEIMSFPSRWFYSGKLEAAPDVKDRGILDYDTSLIWYDTEDCNYQEEFVGESFGRINKNEAHLLIEYMTNYVKRITLERILKEQIDFGIISPYKAQIQYIRRIVKKNKLFHPIRHLITVHTIDGFQGQERDVIIISLVRSNQEGKIGFLNDLRRMNVAITRARMKLIIIGDAHTLSRHSFYHSLYKHISNNGHIIKAEPNLPASS